MLWLAALLVVGVIIWWVRRLPVGPSTGRRTPSGDSGFGSDALLFDVADSGTSDTAGGGDSGGGSSDSGSGGDGGGGSSTAD